MPEMIRASFFLAVALLVTATGCQESSALPEAARSEPSPEAAAAEEPSSSIFLPSEKLAEETIPADLEALAKRAGELSKNDPEKSLPLFQRLIETNHRTGNLGKLTENLLWRGEAYKRLGRNDQAASDFERALLLSKVEGNLFNQAQAFTCLGVLTKLKGELGGAGEYYRAAADILRRLPRSENIEKKLYFQVLRNLAGLSQMENHPRLAQGFLDEAARLAAADDARSQAQLSIDRAWFAELEGDPREAHRHLGHAFESWQQLPLDDQILFWTRLALNLSELERAAEAMQANLHALELTRSIRDKAIDRGVWSNLCRLSVLSPALDRQRPEKPFCDSAGEAAQGAPNSGVFYWQARRLEQRGQLPQAIDLAQKAMEASEDQRSQVAGRNGRARFIVGRAEMYGFLADLLMEAHRQDPSAGFDLRAMRISERLKARVLLDLQSEAKNGRRAELPVKLREELGSRRSELEALQQQRGTEEGEARIESLLAEMDRLFERPRSSALAESPGSQGNQIPLAEIQASLDPQTAVLLLLFGKSKAYLFTVRNTGSVRADELAGPDKLTAAANAFLELAGDPQKRLSPSVAEAGERIARLLWGKNEERLKDLPKRILFVGDGDLQQFPLQAIPRLFSRSAERQYLIDTHEVVHLPSLSMLHQNRSKSRRAAGKPTRGMIVFGDPLHWIKPGVPAQGLRPLTKEELAEYFGPQMIDLPLGRLPDADVETESIRRVFARRSIEIARGPDASRERALADEIGTYSIIHFASHGRVDEFHDELSALMLSEVDREGGPVEGALRLQDLYLLPPLRAELVVASACQTGVGNNLRLEGIGGIAQGFLQAGARRVVLSLWQVDSRTTAIFMERFHTHLESGAEPGAALRLAGLDLRERARREQKPWGSPFYWAPFILVGDWHSFELPPKLSPD